MTQLELEQQLGGLFGLLTVEFLVPYLNRKLNVFQKTGEIPRIPKGMVKPTIVAGINSLGRGQDVQALGAFLTTIAQTMGPEAITQYINPDEVIKRLAAAQGIDVLNLVKSVQEIQQQEQMAQQQAMELEETKLGGQVLNSPMLDPTKNPALAEQIAPPEGAGPLPPEA
jgi:rRNA-processing protein FCF1